MKAQIIERNDGTIAGVFVAIEDWNLLKERLPDMEFDDEYFHQWQKDILNERLKDVSKGDNILPVEDLIRFMDEAV